MPLRTTLQTGAAGLKGEFVTPVTNSLHLFMVSMFPTRVAKFRCFEPVLMFLPVLRGRVVPVLTVAAL